MAGPGLTLTQFSGGDKVDSFDTQVLPKVAEMESKRASIVGSITTAKSSFSSASSGIGSGWTNGSGVGVKSALDNTIVEGTNRIEISMNGSLATLISKIGEFKEPIDYIKDLIKVTNNLKCGENVPKASSTSTSKSEKGTSKTSSTSDSKSGGSTSKTSSTSNPESNSVYQANDQAQIDANYKIIESAVAAVAQAIDSLAAAATGESLGIVGNVCNGVPLGAMTTMDLSTITVPSFSSPSGTSTTTSAGSIDELKAQVEADVEYLNTTEKVPSADFFSSEKGKEVMSHLMAYYNVVNNAYLNGEITYDQHKEYMESLHGSTHKSLYSILYWRVNDMAGTRQGDISFLGDDLLEADKKFYDYLNQYWSDDGKVSPDVISDKSFDELNGIVQNKSKSKEEREAAAVAAMIDIRQGYLDGTYSITEAKKKFEAVTNGEGYWLANNGVSGWVPVYGAFANWGNGTTGLDHVFTETQRWLDTAQKYDTASLELGVPTYYNSNTTTSTSTSSETDTI